MSERVLRVGRWVFAALILLFVVRTFGRNWSDLQSEPVAWTFRPLPAVGSILLVWTMYAMLIATWRAMLEGWGQRIRPIDAARIWTVSSLGKYVPGKVWAIAGMAMMAREAGVAAWVATASAVILQLLAIGTGVLAAGVGGAGVLDPSRPGQSLGYWLSGGLGVISVVGLAVLVNPRVTKRALALAGIPAPDSVPPMGLIAVGAVVNFVAWLGYGGALWLLARAVLPDTNLAPTAAIGAFAASYVAGLVALFAPGGLLVREGLMVALLQGSIGLGAATALALASRVLLTITEVGAAVPFLLLRRSAPRVA